MEQNKTKILSDLYAIRATMSLIAENDDEAEPERRKIRECNGSISFYKNSIAEKQKNMRNELSAFLIDKKIDELKAESQELEEVYSEAKTKYINAEFDANSNFLARFFNCWVGSLVYLFDELPILALILVINFPILILWAIILIPISIPRAIYVKKAAKKSAKSWEAKMKQYKDQITRISMEISALTQRKDAGNAWIDCREVNAAEQDMKNFEAEKNCQIVAIQQEIPVHKTAIQIFAKKSQVIVESAHKAYPLVDLRDWRNVDLLIYYFETGRADDMKEALQLVDRQRQTDQIANALKMASAEICKTIQYSTTQLGNALAQSFSLLSSQMAQQHAEMLTAMEEQTAEQRSASEAQLKEIRAQTAAQLSSQAMNRALLEKISKSSADLAYQMDRQMREVHEILV